VNTDTRVVLTAPQGRLKGTLQDLLSTLNVTVPILNCNNKPYRAPERLCRNFQYDGRRFWGSRTPAWNRIAVEKEYKRIVPPGS
jgi:hypothetical protein